MKIVDLTEEHQGLFALCLEDWSPEAAEAGPRRACWIERELRRGLRAKLALEDDGTVAGMIQYLPIEHSNVDGKGLYFILCIWVHGHPKGRGNLQGRGMGSALLRAAEDDARQLGAAGMAAWGLWLPFWMKASWFRRHGYQKVERQGMAMLVWKPFRDDAQPPHWFPVGHAPAPTPGKVTVTAFRNGWCMAMNLGFERAKRMAAEFGDRVTYRELDTSERPAIEQWGFSDALFIDGKEVTLGPPPSCEKIHKLLAKRVAKL